MFYSTVLLITFSSFSIWLCSGSSLALDSLMIVRTTDNSLPLNSSCSLSSGRPPSSVRMAPEEVTMTLKDIRLASFAFMCISYTISHAPPVHANSCEPVVLSSCSKYCRSVQLISLGIDSSNALYSSGVISS